jgi:hypothetical protein
VKASPAFGVSYGMVIKLLQQGRKTGCIKPEITLF